MSTKEEIQKQLQQLKSELLQIQKAERSKKYDRKSKHICEICDGKYTLANKSIHLKSKKHILAFENMKQLRRIARSKTLEGRAGSPD